jgi:hypothetical protein
VRLADAILRRGHLSDDALVDMYMTGERPVHLERCDICAERAVELGRWLDDVRAIGSEEADAAFPPERLVLQQAQILRRLEQADRPARVIAFPGPVQDRFGMNGHGIRPAWVAVAAAAGLVLGLFGGQFSARLGMDRAAAPAAPTTIQRSAPAPTPSVSTAAMTFTPLDLDQSDMPQIDAANYIDAYTPFALPASDHVIMAVK